MDRVFGAGGWERQRFESARLPASGFMYVEGGNGASAEFERFISNNRTALEDWVAQGNRLLINAARWGTQPDLNLGFGATLQGNGYHLGGRAIWTHEIFDNLSATTWTNIADWFSMDRIAGDGFRTLMLGFDGIEGADLTDRILVEREWGRGYVMIGGMTSPFYHEPQEDARLLRDHMIDFAADGLIGIPEPEMLSILIGSAGWVILRKRRR